MDFFLYELRRKAILYSRRKKYFHCLKNLFWALKKIVAIEKHKMLIKNLHGCKVKLYRMSCNNLQKEVFQALAIEMLLCFPQRSVP